MSWVSKIGDAFQATGEKIGDAYVAARDSTAWSAIVNLTPFTADTAYHPERIGLPAPSPQQQQDYTRGQQLGGQALHKPYEYAVARPISTGFGMNVTNVFDRNAWKENWNASAPLVKSDSGKTVEGISPGQRIIGQSGVLNLAFRNGQYVPMDFSDKAVSEREEYFHNTFAGQAASGLVDASLNWFSDPLAIGAKGAKIREARNITLRPGDSGRVLAAAAGSEERSRRINRLGEDMRRRHAATDGMSYVELAAHPGFRTTGDPTVVAHFYDEANKIEDVAERHARKRLIDGALLGNRESITQLQSESSALANRLRRATDVVETADGSIAFSFDDMGELEIRYFNRADNIDEIMATQDERVKSQITQMNRMLDLQGTTNRLTGDAREQAANALRMRGIRETMVMDGVFGRPTRVVSGATTARLRDHVEVFDGASGYRDFEETLKRVKWFSAEQRSKYLTEYGKSTNKGERAQVVERAHNAMYTAAGRAQATPLSATEIRTLMATTNGVAKKYRAALQARVYSAASKDPTDPTYFVDSDGVAHAYDTPWLSSQIANKVNFTSPESLDWALKKNTQTRWLEQIAARVNAKQSATDILNGSDELAKIAEDIAGPIMTVWKSAALMRGAYLPRVQLDSQLRNWAATNTLVYGLSLTRGVLNTARNASVRRAARKSGTELEPGDLRTDLMRIEKYESPTGQIVDITPAVDGEELAVLNSTLSSSQTSQILANHTMGLVEEARGSGGWEIVTPADPTWDQSYLRVANNQIRNSKVAMIVLASSDDAAAAKAIKANPAAMAEYKFFDHRYESVEEYVSSIRPHLDRLVPYEELRRTMLDRNVNMDDITKHFATVDKRMNIHGEQYSPLHDNAASKMIRSFRDNWFKVMSDIPDKVAARHPLYNLKFRENMRAMIDRFEGEELTQADLARIRKAADRLARKDLSETLYDLTRRSDAAYSMRFLSPFYGAWDDVMRKWGKLLYDKPELAIRGMAAWKSPDRNGMVDDQGNVYLPQSLSFGLGPGLQYKMRKDSINSVFQGEPWWLPGYGPLVQVPANELVKRSSLAKAAESNPFLKMLLPYGISDESPVTQFLPGWVRQAQNSRPGSGEFEQTYAMLASIEANRKIRGERKTDVTRGEIMKRTENWYKMRAFMSNVIPVSITPGPSQGLQFYIDRAHELRSQYGSEEGAQKFYDEHPEYFELSISLSANETGIQATVPAFDAARENSKLIAENPKFGWLYVGSQNVGEFNSGVYQYQKSNSVGGGSAKTFRGYKDPQEAISQLEAERGWMEFNKVQTAINLEMKRRGLRNLQQRGAWDLKEAKRLYVAQLGDKYGAWASAYEKSSRGGIEDVVRAAEKGWSLDKKFRDRKDQVLLRRYLASREQMRALMKARGGGTLDSQGNEDLSLVWSTYTQQLVEEDIGFEQIFNRALQNDRIDSDLLGVK